MASSSPVNHEKVKKEFIKGIVKLARHKEFYGHIIQQFQKVWERGGTEPVVLGPDGKPADSDSEPETSTGIETAAVGRIPGERFIKMYLNTTFFGKILQNEDRKISEAHMLGVLEHEVLHVVFGHLFMRLQDKTRGGVAMDCVINGTINPKNDKNILPGKYVHPENYGFPLDKSALWYYTHLRDNEEYKKQCASGAFGKDGIMSHIMSSHGMWDDIMDDPLAQEFAKDIVRKSKDMCKSWGTIPGNVVDQIDSLLKRKKAIIPWGRVLRMFVASATDSILDYTMKRKSRRFGTRPGTRKGDVLEIAVAIDTSASISDKQIQMFWHEIRWIWKNGATIWVYECDTNLSERSPFRFKGKWDGTAHGRGGTELEPVLKAVEGKYDALVYFTDFYARDVSRKYRIPTLWVLSTDMAKEDYPYPWGKHIKIDNNKAVAA